MHGQGFREKFYQGYEDRHWAPLFSWALVELV